VREKDGLWAVLLWLNVLAVRRQPVAQIMQEHWAGHGRDYYSRHDYEGVDADRAKALIEGLRVRLPEFPGTEAAGLTVVMNRCPKIEFGRLHTELSWGGFNSKVITARRRKVIFP
jgi:phosphoglucomutase